MSWFLELAEELALFGEITLCVLWPGNIIFIFGGELLALIWLCFANLEIGFNCRAVFRSSWPAGTVTRNSRGGAAWKTGTGTRCW